MAIFGRDYPKKESPNTGVGHERLPISRYISEAIKGEEILL